MAETIMQKNILYIDDVETNLFTVESVLQTQEGKPYKMFGATSAQQGFEILAKESIDIILLDVMMPEIDGFQTAKMLRKNHKTKNIPFIFMTAKKDDETIEKCFLNGAVDYIPKPFNATELIHRLALHIRLKESEKELQEEALFMQNVFDLQDNFIVVMDQDNLVTLNRATLEFFAVATQEEFTSKYGCICNVFMQEDGCFYLETVPDEQPWVEYVMQQVQSKEVIVKMEDANGSAHYFSIKATRFGEKHIFSFTDITKTMQRSKVLEHEAHYDTLTKIYNRAMLQTLLAQKMQNGNEYQGFVLCIFDIDHFKQVNDTYGHLRGDYVLSYLAQIVTQQIRSSDIFARWGGEEFILIFDTTVEKGLNKIESLRKTIAKTPFEEVEHITCSFGVAYAKESDTPQSLLKRADEALYRAKEGGRDQVCFEECDATKDLKSSPRSA